MESIDPKDLPGLKVNELQKLGRCVICKKKVLEGAEPTFYIVRMRRAMWDPKAVQRAASLEMMLGSAIAGAMGPDEDLAKVFDGPHEVAVHERCAGEVFHLLNLIPQDGEATP